MVKTKSFADAALEAIEVSIGLHILGSRAWISLDKEKTKKIGETVIVVFAEPDPDAEPFELILLNETVGDLEIRSGIYSHNYKGRPVWVYRSLDRSLTIWPS